MSLSGDHPGLADALARLSPYLCARVEDAGERALTLHAEEVGLEHLIWSLMLDEDSALFVTVDQAFADTDTVAADALSLCSGILVSTRAGALPFSTRGVEASRGARALARERGLSEVGPACLALGAAAELEDELARDLAEAGLDLERVRGQLAQGEAPLELEGHLFRAFANATRQALVVAARAAAAATEPSIGPARLLVAALEADAALAEVAGLPARRARVAIEGRAVDLSPPPARLLPPDSCLLDFLARLPEGAGSLDVAEAVLEDPGSELAQVFGRQKVTPHLLERARAAYDDPAC